MFKLNFHISADQFSTKNLNLEEEVYGFLELQFGEQTYGFCPKEPIAAEGNDLLSTWFDQLTEVCVLLKAYPIILINDITSYNSWLQIQRQRRGILVIDQIISLKKSGSRSILTEPISDAEQGQINNAEVIEDEFRQEIMASAKEFLSALNDIDEKYMDTEWVKRISDNMSSFQ
ncbi:hypothetical protein [Cohnella lupini]|uniref:Uncharacterized protein n=1 Tax=Cohnella lupini TaxID=1294267 RepID=A0A3D9ICA1_9BACL|nr:hypothetical protein [Cohnella lupini]RED59179.1 hypothetical protein DFP95_10717 [Cohnella lupini]